MNTNDAKKLARALWDDATNAEATKVAVIRCLSLIADSDDAEATAATLLEAWATLKPR